MNQTFSPARFARLHRWLWATKRRTYLIGTGVVLLLIGLILSPPLWAETYLDGPQNAHVAYFLVLGLLLMSSFGSDVFSMLFRQESAITYLMIPASRTEKFGLGALYCLVALLLATIAFFGLEALIFSVVNSRLPVGSQKYVPSPLYFQSQPIGWFWVALPLYALLLSLAVALLGSFYFRRGVFIRNAGITVVGAVGLTFLYRVVVISQLPALASVGTQMPFSDIWVDVNTSWLSLKPPLWLRYAAYAGTLVLLWITARIRFNEIER
jgi:hypothetical protein